MTTKPWHYDATEGRPDWSKVMGQECAIERQDRNEERRAAERAGRK